MRRKLVLFLTLTSFALFSCGQSDKFRQGNSCSKADSGAALSSGVSSSGKNDTLPVDADISPKADIQKLEALKSALSRILEKDLIGADSSARRFIYSESDLNDDGKMETFVGLRGMNWCGSGGCTALLLSSDLRLVTRFTVASFPFNIQEAKTKGWRNLVVYSGGANRLLKWDGKSYPSNPSVAAKFTEKTMTGSQKALNSDAKPDSWLRF